MSWRPRTVDHVHIHMPRTALRCAANLTGKLIVRRSTCNNFNIKSEQHGQGVRSTVAIIWTLIIYKTISISKIEIDNKLLRLARLGYLSPVGSSHVYFDFERDYTTQPSPSCLCQWLTCQILDSLSMALSPHYNAHARNGTPPRARSAHVYVYPNGNRPLLKHR